MNGLILNHTSDRHPWFVSLRASRSWPHREATAELSPGPYAGLVIHEE